jgi:hypothetical protein
MTAGSRIKGGAAKVGATVSSTVGGAVKTTARKAGAAAKATADRAEIAIKETRGPSPNPLTNLVIADIALRGSGRLLRHLIERTLLGVKYSDGKAHKIIDGRTMTQTLIGTAAARIATRSVPGALVVGGGLLAKTLYDRSRNRAEVKAEGEKAIEEQAKDA